MGTPYAMLGLVWKGDSEYNEKTNRKKILKWSDRFSTLVKCKPILKSA